MPSIGLPHLTEPVAPWTSFTCRPGTRRADARQGDPPFDGYREGGTAVVLRGLSRVSTGARTPTTSFRHKGVDPLLPTPYSLLSLMYVVHVVSQLAG